MSKKRPRNLLYELKRHISPFFTLNFKSMKHDFFNELSARIKHFGMTPFSPAKTKCFVEEVWPEIKVSVTLVQ